LTTVAELEEKIANVIGIEDSSPFAIFEEDTNGDDRVLEKSERLTLYLNFIPDLSTN
jgi:hypothetical protein